LNWAGDKPAFFITKYGTFRQKRELRAEGGV